jgi:tetratricopeptide (TPR) repeat protein
VAIATSLNDISLKLSANLSLGQLGQTTGKYRDAAERLTRSVEALEGDRFYDWSGAGTLRSVFSRERLAWCLAELGKFTEATARGEEAARIAREVDHHHSLVLAHRSLGLVALRQGDVPKALPQLERALQECRDAQTRSFVDVTAGHLGYAYVLSGRLSEGVTLMEEALADPAATGTTNHPLLLAYLGEAHLLAGRRDDALAIARRALDLAHRQKERGNEAWVLRLLGEIAAEADPPDPESADAHYRQALARADELGMRPLAAHCHLGLGRVHRHAGRKEGAREHFTTAATMYREMDMGSWLEKAEAQLTWLR